MPGPGGLLGWPAIGGAGAGLLTTAAYEAEEAAAGFLGAPHPLLRIGTVAIAIGSPGSPHPLLRMGTKEAAAGGIRSLLAFWMGGGGGGITPVATFMPVFRPRRR